MLRDVSFPMIVSIFGFSIPGHFLFEVLAYASGFWLYRRLRIRRGDFLPDSRRSTMFVAVVLGAAAGSKLLHHASHPTLLAAHWQDPRFLLGGKTMVGALLGGWIAVEWTKKRVGIRRATGDLYALPLCLGIAVGRIGCFVHGLEDRTFGTPTALPWAIDLGDGVTRHPVALYEIVFLAALAFYLAIRPPRGEGALFRGFLIGYLLFRFFVDFLKPYETIAGLGAIQWACLAGVAWYAVAAARARVEQPRAFHV